MNIGTWGRGENSHSLSFAFLLSQLLRCSFFLGIQGRGDIPRFIFTTDSARAGKNVFKNIENVG